MTTKVLILNEMLPGKKGVIYSPFNAIEAQCTDEEVLFLEEIHGRDLTSPSSKEDSIVEKFLEFLYDFSQEKPILKHTQVIKTDHGESTQRLGPYDRVFHVIY